MSQGAEAVAADEPGSATAAKEHDRLSRNNFGTIRGFGYPKDQPVVWVKCSYNSEQLHSEALTQIYAHEHLVDLPEAQRNGVFVPRVYKTYYVTLDDIDWTYALIVMEYIRGVSVKQLLRETENNKPRRELFISRVSALSMRFWPWNPTQIRRQAPKAVAGSSTSSLTRMTPRRRKNSIACRTYKTRSANML